eukprot:7478-Heterococcus_DN1.PRE.1
MLLQLVLAASSRADVHSADNQHYCSAYNTVQKCECAQLPDYKEQCIAAAAVLTVGMLQLKRSCNDMFSSTSVHLIHGQ